MKTEKRRTLNPLTYLHFSCPDFSPRASDLSRNLADSGRIPQSRAVRLGPPSPVLRFSAKEKHKHTQMRYFRRVYLAWWQLSGVPSITKRCQIWCWLWWISWWLPAEVWRSHLCWQNNETLLWNEYSQFCSVLGLNVNHAVLNVTEVSL